MKKNVSTVSISTATRKRLNFYKLIWDVKSIDELLNIILDKFDEMKLNNENNEATL